MTITEFKIILSDDELGSPDTQVLLLFNEYTGAINRIDAVAVRITEENLPQLQQATNLILTIPGSGELINIAVTNSIEPLRTIDRSIESAYFLYYIIQEDQRPIIAAPTIGVEGYESYTTQLIIQPGDFETNYEFSDYNPLIDNATEARESVYRFKSDRARSTISPTNLAGILSKTAVPAAVQDSNYTAAGWTRGRYEGTKLSAANNTGIDPSLQGTFFEAATFPSDAVDTDIIGLAGNGSVPFSTYFFTGIGETPKYIREETGWTWETTYYGFGTLYITTLNSNRKDFKIGDLLAIQNPAITQPTYASESLVRVLPANSQTLNPYNSYTLTGAVTLANMTVETSYNGTPYLFGAATAATPPVLRISTTQIYIFQNGILRAAPKQKMVVKGIDEVLYIDKYGRVVGGSNPVAL